MKKLKLPFLLLLILLSTTSIAKAQEEGCTIENVEFNSKGDYAESAVATLKIKNSSCDKEGLSVRIFEVENAKYAGITNHRIAEKPFFNNTDEDSLYLNYSIGSSSCDITSDPDCYFIPVISSKGSIVFPKNVQATQGETFTEALARKGRELKDSQIIKIECDGFCDSFRGWALISTEDIDINQLDTENCSIESVVFEPNRVEYIKGQQVKLKIKSSGCAAGYNLYINDQLHKPILLKKGTNPYIPNNGELELRIKTDETTYCENDNIDEYGYQCAYYISIDSKLEQRIYNSKTEKNGQKYTQKNLSELIRANSKDTFAGNCPKDDCSFFAGNTWKLVSSTDPSKNIKHYEGEEIKRNINQESKCINSEGTGYVENCYEFLAPIPGLGDKSPNGKIEAGVIRDISTFQLGTYINQIYTVGIALLAVLAVLMMIAAGVQYMTTETFYGKSHARSQMTNSAIGLLLALSIYFIIKTINPTLLEINFGENIKPAEINIDNPPEIVNGEYIIGGKAFSVNGVNLKKSGDWIPGNAKDWKSIKDINSKIKVNKPNDCSRIGESCTSLYFKNNIYEKLKTELNNLQKECDCQFTITGGSEFWWHSTHGPYSATVDISINPQHGSTKEDIKKLNSALTCGQTDSFTTARKSGSFGYLSKSKCFDNLLPYAEGGKQPHWHIDFK